MAFVNSRDSADITSLLKAFSQGDEARESIRGGAKVIELRFFGGSSVEETAAVLQTSPQSVMRDWRLAGGRGSHEELEGKKP